MYMAAQFFQGRQGLDGGFHRVQKEKDCLAKLPQTHIGGTDLEVHFQEMLKEARQGRQCGLAVDL